MVQALRRLRLVLVVVYHLVERHEGLLRVLSGETRPMLCHLGALAMVGARNVERWRLLVEIYHIPVS